MIKWHAELYTHAAHTAARYIFNVSIRGIGSGFHGRHFVNSKLPVRGSTCRARRAAREQ